MAQRLIGVGIANQLISVRTGTSGVDWGQATNTGKSLLLSPLVGFGVAAILLLISRSVLKIRKLYEAPEGTEPPPFWIRAQLILTCTGVSFVSLPMPSSAMPEPRSPTTFVVRHAGQYHARTFFRYRRYHGRQSLWPAVGHRAQPHHGLGSYSSRGHDVVRVLVLGLPPHLLNELGVRRTLLSASLFSAG